jgi:trimethylamine---corrinoid protein Co-methyltransferase
MSKFSFANLPQLQLINQEQILEIHKNALEILESTGVRFEYHEALEILETAGCQVDYQTMVAKIPGNVVEDAVRSAPETFSLFDREGSFYCEFGDGQPRFNPGSSSVLVLDRDGKTSRSSTAMDLIAITKVAQAMPQIDFVSSSVVAEEAPLNLGSQLIYLTEIKHSKKPIIGGAVDEAGPKRTFELLKAVRGSEAEARKKPYTIFDICSVSPLSYSHIGASNIIDCARLDIPIELICASIAGVTAPVSLAGALLQHTVEILAGVVLSQVVKPGTPVVYGGAPCTFNMKTTYTPMNSIEGDMIRCGYGVMGKYYGLPTHTYAALSDAKLIDYQAGFESGRSALLAVQAGFDNMSGAGGLNVIAEMSPEKLVMDAEVIGLIKHYNKGINMTGDSLAKDVIERVGAAGSFLSERHTLNHFRKEYCYDGDVLNFMDRAAWMKQGAPDIMTKAKDKVDRILRDNSNYIDPERESALDQAFVTICLEAGIEDPKQYIKFSKPKELWEKDEQ